MPTDCLFCKIVTGDVKADVVHETETTIAFRDIEPQAPTHVLVVPRRHEPDAAALAKAAPNELVDLVQAAAAVAEQDGLGEGYRLVRREFPTAIGPVDIMARDPAGIAVAIEIKRRGEIDGVEQLTRYLELLNRDPLLAPVRGVFAAQEIKPQARTLAEDRGITCLVLDYDLLRGRDDPSQRLF